METPPAGISPAAYEVPFRTSPADYEASAAADPLAPFRGLSVISDDIIAELPPDCRAAFDKARQEEVDWFNKWGDEAKNTSRREPIVDKAIVPYPVMMH